MVVKTTPLQELVHLVADLVVALVPFVGTAVHARDGTDRGPVP